MVIAGIDTGVGKTMATGLLARELLDRGRRVITQKIVQTGCPDGRPEDIEAHRRLMGIELQQEDRNGSTCPYVFAHPASPHLAAEIEGRGIDIMHIRRATFALQKAYDVVLLEGAGGLLVPLGRELLFADYIRDAGYTMLLVSSSRIGSINHTLLSLEACVRRGIAVRGVIYNRFDETDGVVAADTRKIFETYLRKYEFSSPVVDLHEGSFSPGVLEQLSL
jgi:dethiobiotin synthetase